MEIILDHFQENGQADLTFLIMTGGWLEFLYIICEKASLRPNELLNNRIAEQKIILEQLLLLLSFYEDNMDIKSLIGALSELRTGYNEATIVYEYKDSVYKEENGVLIVEDNTTSQINFTAETLEHIFKSVKQIRNKIIDTK